MRISPCQRPVDGRGKPYQSSFSFDVLTRDSTTLEPKVCLPRRALVPAYLPRLACRLRDGWPVEWHCLTCEHGPEDEI